MFISRFREFTFHFFTMVAIFISIFFVIPNLSSNKENYKSDSKTMQSSRIDEREYTGKYGNKKIEHTLVIVMTDQTELKFSASAYSKYFEELQKENNIGKEIKYYQGNNTKKNINPIQVEIDNEIVYNTNENAKSKYLILLLTLGLLIYSGYKLKKYLKTKNINKKNSR